MKKYLVLLLFVVFGISLEAQNEVSLEWLKQNYQKRDVMIPMRDGVKLFAAVYEPTANHVSGDVLHPILINRTPYGCDPYGDNLQGPLLGMNMAPYVKAGYIIVFTDVRGKNFSEGEFQHIRPFIPDKKKKQTDEASDTYDTVDWLVKHTKNNQRVGIYGVSYNGFYATMGALCNHPAVKAVSPQAPVTDWFRGDDLHHNGALFQMDMPNFLYWFRYQNTKEVRTGKVNPDSMIRPREIVKNDCYTDYLKFGAVKHYTEMLDTVDFWKELVHHPDLDDWWESRNVSYHLKNVKPAMMVVGGLFDAEDCYGAWQTYRAVRNQSPSTDLYLVMGPWSHGQWDGGARPFFGDIYFGDEMTSEYYINNIEYPFFAYYLEGKGRKPASGATIFQTGENRWHNYPEGWGNATLTPYYIYSDGTLSTKQPSLGKSMTYTSDPEHPVPYFGPIHESRQSEYMFADQRFASRRPDVLSFSTPVLTDSLRLDGEVDVDLSVSITTTDADFVVKIIDVFPDGFRYEKSLYEKAYPGRGNYHAPNLGGYEMLVRGDVMRGKYREGFSTPKAFVPGEKTTVKFRLPDVAHTFLPGHRMLVQIQSSWFPLVDRNPQRFCNIYECDDDDFQKSDITIYEGSRILLPVR